MYSTLSTSLVERLSSECNERAIKRLWGNLGPLFCASRSGLDGMRTKGERAAHSLFLGKWGSGAHKGQNAPAAF